MECWVSIQGLQPAGLANLPTSPSPAPMEGMRVYSMGNGIAKLVVILTVLLVLASISCQKAAPETLGEKVVAIDGQAAYAKRADSLIRSIAGACSFLTGEEDVLDMAIKTRDTFRDNSGTEVSVLQVLEAANDTVMSSETRPVDCEEVFTGAVVLIILEDALAGQ